MPDTLPPPDAQIWPPPPPPVVEPPPETVAGAHPDDGWPLAEPWLMSPSALASLDGLVRALCPGPPAPWSQSIAAQTALGTRTFLRYLPPLLGIGFALAIRLLDWSPVWRLRGLFRLRDMDREAAGALLQSMAESRLKPLRLLMMGARAAVLSSYYDLEEVHSAMGYHPMPFLQQRTDLRRRLLTGERPTEADLMGPSVEAGR
ncbi:MAG: hypothetical protein ABIO70_05565 [Pseudomonadota bacterium]